MNQATRFKVGTNQKSGEKNDSVAIQRQLLQQVSTIHLHAAIDLDGLLLATALEGPDLWLRIVGVSEAIIRWSTSSLRQ